MPIRRECHKLKLLQQFGFRKSAYERPTQKWVCGHLDAGKPCRVGPDGRGVCQASFECVPMKTDARWHCTRPTSRGGKCEQGPGPDGVCCKAIPKCRPKLTLRAKRARATRWIASLAVGFLAVIFAYAGDINLLMPGPLNTAHSSLKSCGDCHANVSSGEFDWIHSIFGPSDPVKDSGACLKCHKIGTDALNPHNLALDKLAALTERHQAAVQANTEPIMASFRQALFPAGKTFEKGVFCATCHKEHQGEKFDLKAMADVQCQTCHTAQFSNFKNGHPQFTDYPYGRRTRVIFDHSSHFSEHFPKALADNKNVKSLPGVCADCHTPSANSGLMAVKPFEQMCSTCHIGQIVGTDRATGPKGITFLALPGLDVETLREKKADIGEWPEDSEAEIAPLMKLLIGWDEERREMLRTVEKLDLLDLTEATDEEIAAVEKLVWEVKSLVYQLAWTKTSDVMKMQGAAMASEVDPKLLASLTANLSRDVLLGVQRDWLPNLPTEVLRHRRGEPMTPATAPDPVEEPGDKKTEGEGLDTPPEKTADGSKPDQSDILSGDDSILAENKNDDILSGDEAKTPADKKDDDILSGDDSILAENKDDDILAGEEKESEVAATDKPVTKEELPAPMAAEAWAEFGGWYRQEFAVLYKPVGHKDKFMQAWLDFSGRQYGKADSNLASPVFDRLTGKDAQGKCAKCHSVDSGDGDSLKINWSPFSVTNSLERFTKFSHEPHFGLFGEKGCVACHEINGAAKYQQTYKANDPKVFASNFKPVEQQVCTVCHQKTAAGEGCLLCHIYHVENISTPIMQTKLPGK